MSDKEATDMIARAVWLLFDAVVPEYDILDSSRLEAMLSINFAGKCVNVCGLSVAVGIESCRH